MKKSEQPQSGGADGIDIDQDLIIEGITQLSSEIQLLENWLEELSTSDDNDSEVVAARKSYYDMLRSRREMLGALNQHNKSDSL